MNDYVRGLSALKNLLPEVALLEFETLEARMLDNLHREGLYGSTRETTAERFTIVDTLNQLARQHGTKSFTELCFHPQTVKVSTSKTLPVDTDFAGSETGADSKVVVPPSSSSSKFSNQIQGNVGNIIQGDHANIKINRRTEQQSSKVIVLPQVEVKFLTHMIPTAYYHLLNEVFPLFHVTIDNSNSYGDDASLSVSAFIEDYSDLAKTTVTVAKGECKDVMLLLVLKHSMLATLNDIRKVTLQINVRQDFPHLRNIYDTAEPVYLMARNRALIGIRSEDKSVIDLTKYLVAWVTPNHPEIARILRYVYDYHPNKKLNGYQDGESSEETARSVREQARAIFSTLKDKAGLVYTNSALNWEIQPGLITQKVRLPSECLAQGGLANCLEGTILFASLLELIGIEPLLVLVPGHAFVGWRIEHDSDQYEFLDTSMIGTADFGQAQAHARNLYVQAMDKKDFERELFYRPGFARLIDIVHHRREGIYPLE
jgi:hypothetical protein